MERKKKICKGTGRFEGKGCGEEKYIFGHGLCQICYQRANYKPNQYYGKNIKRKRSILKFKPTIQDEKELKQSDTFLLAWNYWQGKCFIGLDTIKLEDLQAWNCIHVLDKKNYPYFKYYYKNVVIGHRAQHDLIDQGTKMGIEIRLKWCKNETQSMWDSFFEYRKELLKEYRAWVKTNHGCYKLG